MKKCLIVVDFQNDFVTGSLGFDGAEELDGIICGKIADCRADGGEVIFTFDTHNECYLSTQEGKKLPIEHCISGTRGHELFGGVAKAKKPDDKCVYKSSFGSEELFDYLRKKDFEQIELCGLVTDICVIANAVLAKTALPECEIIVDSSATSCADTAKKQAALEVMKSLQIEVL